MTRSDAPDWMWTQALQVLARADRMHQQMFRPNGTRQRRPTWEPPVDVLETETKVMVLAALPGVDIHAVEAVIEDGWLHFQSKEALPPPDDFFLPLSEGKNRISQISCEIVMGTSQNAKNIYKNSIQFYIDSAKIKGELFARSGKPGDSIRTRGMTKSLKKLLCEKKIPLELRARLPIICDSDAILAVPFVEIRDGMSADQNSDRAMAIHIYFN
jgi:tRNA(Ile)-lysidine synthetase-like protein